MSATSKTIKGIVEEVLTARTAKFLWSSIYHPVFPFTPLSFSIGNVLPAMLYMMRWGHRRGRGKFFSSFGSNIKGSPRSVSIDEVAEKLDA